MSFWPDEPVSHHPVSGAALLAVLAFAALCLGFHAFGEQGWVPVLDSFNLALHEAGHPLVGLFSERLMVYGGTLFQLGFPLAVAWHFQRRDHTVGTAAALVWLGESGLNVARYMADARAQVLPLVGGGKTKFQPVFALRFDLSQLDPVAGLGRMFSGRNLFALVKGVVVTVAVILVGAFTIWQSIKAVRSMAS